MSHHWDEQNVPATMQALVVEGPDNWRTREVRTPKISPYEALVKIEVCGVCSSTDQKLIEGTMFWAPPFPLVLGHESVGKVIAVGDKVQHFAIGDRVTRPIYRDPEGQLHAANGGFAQFGLVTDARAMSLDGDDSLSGDYNANRQLVVPQSMSAADAALCISLSECASVLRHLPNVRGCKIVVAGTGIAGLAFTLWLKLSGAFVVTLGRRKARLKKALEVGADRVVDTSQTNYLAQLEAVCQGAVDGVIEATGDAILANHLLESIKPEGFACAYGVPPTGLAFDARWKSAIVEEHLAFAWVADSLRRGWIQSQWFESQNFKWHEVSEAWQSIRKGQVVKAFIELP